VATVWLAVLVVYLVIFYAAPLSQSAGARPFARAEMLRLILLPELYWEAWTAKGTMRLALLDRTPIVVVTMFLLTLAAGLGWAVLNLAGIRGFT
jgi:hypothetical protein